MDLGEYAQALPPRMALMKLAPHSADNAMTLALTYSLLHRKEDAVKAFDLAQPDTPLANALVAAGRLTYQSLPEPKLHAQSFATVYALRSRSDIDPTSMVDVIQLCAAGPRRDRRLAALSRPSRRRHQWFRTAGRAQARFHQKPAPPMLLFVGARLRATDPTSNRGGGTITDGPPGADDCPPATAAPRAGRRMQSAEGQHFE